MQTVGAGLDGGVNDSTVVVAELRRSVLCDEIELSNRIRGGRKTDEVFRRLVVVNTVQQEVVGLLAIPVDVGTSTLFSKVRSRIHALRINRDCSRSQECQLQKVTSG